MSEGKLFTYFKILLLSIPVSVILIIFLADSFVKEDNAEDAVSEDELAAVEEPEIHLYFGFDTAEMLVERDIVRRNESLGVILNRKGVSHTTIAHIAEASDTIFNVRRIRAGQPYVLLKSKEDEKVQHFIYEVNNTDYVVFTLDDEIAVYRDQKEIETIKRLATGIIESSLYLTLSRNNLPTILAHELSSVYAWAIDFHRLQRGDRFKLAFIEEQIDGKIIGIERIEFAVFYRGNTPFYAFYFEQEGLGDYFDENGNSLRKAFLKAPLQYSRISSGYSQRRFHPVHRVYRPHLGVDYAAPEGTPIKSVGDGVVERASYTSGNGNYVKIRHNSVYSTQYLHMSRFASGIRAGTVVKQGDLIGYVGQTGLATGPHLCFRFWKNGVQVNPLTVEVPPAEPIMDEYKSVYFEIMEKRRKILDKTEFPDQQEALTAKL